MGAGYTPYLEEAFGKKNDAPIFDFRIKELHSISMSGHKWIGAPWPCGIFMTKGKYQLLPVDNPAYIGSSDTTFSGSRNGFSALILWDFISKHSLTDLAERAKKGLDLADYFENKFKEVRDYHSRQDLWFERSPNSITVRFKKVNDEIIYKYSLSSESLYINGKQRNYSHIFLMDFVSKDLIDGFIESLKTAYAFPRQSYELSEMDGGLTQNASNFGETAFGLGLGFK